MWVQKLPSGRYKYYERYKDPRSGAWHTTTITLDNNRRMDKRDAETALRARIRASTALVDNYATVTMKGLVDDYRASQKGLVKPQTAEGNYRKLKKVIEKLGEDTLASKLTAPYVRKCLAAEKPSTYNERLKVFKAMMRWAYREELVSDISYLEKLPKRKDAPTRVKVQDKFLEKDELKKLLDGMKVEHWKLVTEFLALSGLRIGEAIALRKEDVTDHIHVDKTYSKILDRITDTPKTDASVRDVFIQDELKDCVERMTAYCAPVRSLYFIGFDEEPMDYDAYAKYFRENTEAIIGRKLTPHCLRHTHVALLAEAGIPLEEISRRLGHADSDITKDVYMHVTQKLTQIANDRIKGVKILV